MDTKYLLVALLSGGIALLLFLIRHGNKKSDRDDAFVQRHMQVAARYAGFDEAMLSQGSYPSMRQIREGIETNRELLERRALLLHQKMDAIGKADRSRFLLEAGEFFRSVQELSLEFEYAEEGHVDFAEQYLLYAHAFAAGLVPLPEANDLELWVRDSGDLVHVIFGFYREVMLAKDPEQPWMADE